MFGLLIVVAVFATTLFYFFRAKPKAANRRRNSGGIVPSIKAAVVLALLCHIIGLCACLATSAMLSSATRWTLARVDEVTAVRGVVGGAYALGKLCVESFFVLRVFTAFRGSAFALNNFTLCALLLWSSVVCALCGVLFLADARFHAVSLVYAVLDVGLVVALMLLFVRRLAQLLMLQKKEIISWSVEMSTSGTKSSRTGVMSAVSVSSTSPSLSPVSSASVSPCDVEPQ